MALLLGTRLGPYEILSALGAGGMGEVYRATDTKLKRQVAIKILPTALAADTDHLARFQREAQVLASLNHPNIAAIYGLEDTDGVKALVMELVEGEDLAQRISRGAIRLDDALAIAKQIADALEAAHEQAIIHRDLKPANIKVRRDGTVKVLDFGLAKAIEPVAAAGNVTQSPTITTPAKTQAGMILGTAAYMSPEQARGKTVDKRTDIWAFGCVLFEMLTGHRGFAGATTADTISAVLGQDPDWQALPEGTPAVIRRLLQRCLQRDPKRRLHDIADARIELEDVGAIESVSASAAGRRSAPWWPVLAAWTAVVATAAVLATLAVTTRSTATESSSFETTVTQLTNYGGGETSGVISPDGRSFAFVSAHGSTPDIWLRQVSGGDPIRLTNDAAQETDLEFAPDGESIFFTLPDGTASNLWRVRALGGQAQKVLANARLAALSPDGRRVAYYRSEPGGVNVLTVSALDGSRSFALAQDLRPGNAVRPAWSPDGQRVGYVRTALGGPSNLFIVDVATAEMRQITRATRSTEGVESFVWLPDNERVVVAWIGTLFNSDLAVVNVRDSSMTRLTMNPDGAFRTLTISVDGSRLIATLVRTRRELWKVPFGPDPDANGRAATRLLESTYDPMWTFVSRDGNTLLFNSPISGRNLWTMPLDQTAVPRQITSITGNAVAHSSLSPDGSRVAFTSSSVGSADIWVQNVDGTNLRQLTNDVAADSWPIWSPDGRWIAFQSQPDGRTETWRVPADGGPPEKILDVALRGDWIFKTSGAGTWIATTANLQPLKLIDVERGAVVWEDARSGTGLSLPMFSANRRLISLPIQESRDRDAIWVFEALTGTSRLAARFSTPFRIYFRASWVDNDRAFIVNRYETISNVVLFDRFWTR